MFVEGAEERVGSMRISEDVRAIDTMVSLLTVKEVCRVLHVHGNTLRRWNDRGIIGAYRINPRGDRRFSKDDVLELLCRLGEIRKEPRSRR
jgi:excisionase family DNA binding protein